MAAPSVDIAVVGDSGMPGYLSTRYVEPRFNRRYNRGR
ncbi:hypothetical protein FHR94_000119 [Halomonas cerina]|uniref:Uncharacterized protein n=1 Tax=Halomonas cerina TaxID=447424 RepID=A0A839V133_9GAMM|nr:hypothetical protein [Halomonas cerina]